MLKDGWNQKGGDSNGQIESFLARMAAKMSCVFCWVMGYVIPERKPCMSMKTLKILCLSFGVMAFSIGPVLSTGLSTTEMQSTWGGVLSCHACTGYRTCAKLSCDYSNNQCRKTSGGDYHVCESTGDPNDRCSHGSVDCGTVDYCDNGEGGCSSSNLVCTCTIGATRDVTGCNPGHAVI
jgi:hypothetical protein